MLSQDAQAIRNAALLCLARREYSRKELSDKLVKKYHLCSIVAEQLDRLVEENLQSDERFAEAFVRARINRGKGPAFIRKELQQRGLTSELIEEYINPEDLDWKEHARVVYEKKFTSHPIKDIREKAKRLRFMLARGFSLQHVQAIME